MACSQKGSNFCYYIPEEEGLVKPRGKVNTVIYDIVEEGVGNANEQDVGIRMERSAHQVKAQDEVGAIAILIIL